MGKDKKNPALSHRRAGKKRDICITEDNEKVWGNISEDAYTVISFDDVFRDINGVQEQFS